MKAQNFNYAEEPTITEYDVDPNWPHRPDSISEKGWVSGLAIDDEDQVWFIKKGQDPIQVYTTDGKFVKSWGQYGTTPGRFVLPHAIVVDSKGRLYVADRNSARIQVFNQTGKLLDQWSNLIMPWGMSINAKDEIWVCGSSPHWWLRNGKYPEYKDQIFMRFSTDGRVQQIWQIPLEDIGEDKNNPNFSNLNPGEAAGVHCIAQDSKGNLFVGEIYSERAQKFIAITKRPKSDTKHPESDTK